MSELRFDGRVAVITGAGRGLGRAYALLLAAKGAKIIVNDAGGTMRGDASDESPADAVVREIRAAGGEAIANADSVATAEGGAAIIKAAMQHFGRIDILIHNAGIVRGAPINEMSYADFDAVLDVHLRGGFHVLKPAFTAMCAAGYGRIILTSSIGGLYGNFRQANYGAAKAGLIGLANVAALEGAEHGVTCNSIVPGAVTRMAEGIDTSAYPPMTPEMVAPLAAWLAHESCTVTGEMLVSIAGRVSRVFMAESPGLYRPEWTAEAIAEAQATIRDTATPYIAAGHADHIRYSCAMANVEKRHG